MTSATVVAQPRRSPWPLLIVWLLVVLSVISWRRGSIFTGTVDIVVVAKAALATIAVVIAGVLALTARSRRRIGVLAAGFMALIVAISILGAVSTGDYIPSVILAARIALLATTIMLIVSTYQTQTIFWTLLTAMGSVGLFSAITGYQNYLDRGRLTGGIPELQPNEVAALVLPPIVGLAFHIVRRGFRWWNVTLLVVLMAITYLTGSRTGLAVMVIGIVLVLLFARPLTNTIVIVMIAMIPLAYVVVGFTGILEQTISRGAADPTANLLTFSGRTRAWEAVLSTSSDTWPWWLGAGLSVKRVAVVGQYWDTQVLDSSWISSIAQSGMIGTALLAAFVITTIVMSWRSRELRSLTMPLIVLIVGRSFLENGLVESSAIFTLFFTMAVLLDPGTSREFYAVARRDDAVPSPIGYSRQLVYPRTWLMPEAWKHSPDRLQYR